MGSGGMPLPPLNLTNTASSNAAGSSGTFTVNSIGGGGLVQLRFVPWYAWATVALLGVLYLKRKG